MPALIDWIVTETRVIADEAGSGIGRQRPVRSDASGNGYALQHSDFAYLTRIDRRYGDRYYLSVGWTCTAEGSVFPDGLTEGCGDGLVHCGFLASLNS